MKRAAGKISISCRAFVESPAAFPSGLIEGLQDSKSVKEWLCSKYSSPFSFGVDSLKRGFYRLGGWSFDFRPFLKKYIYTDCGSIHTCYAPNIKAVRKANSLRRAERVAAAPEGF